MPKKGFTLIELLVVISIMAIIGVYTLANYESFGEDRNLKSAVLDVVSILRQAQTSATSNTKCNTGYGATWLVEFTNTTTVNLKCAEPSASPTPKKTVQLDVNSASIAIQTLYGNPLASCPSAPPFASPFPTTSFDPLTGKVSFGDLRCTSLTITLQNSKTGSTKSLVIEKGGRIYEQ